MNQYKPKRNLKINPIFPFSAYVVRSYSSDPHASRTHAKQTLK